MNTIIIIEFVRMNLTILVDTLYKIYVIINGGC